jgi:acyl-CoA thioesterase-1
MAQVIALRPRAVILEIGGNDGLRGLPVTQSRRNLEELVGGLRKSGVRVLLVGMTLPRNYGPAYVAQFEQMYDEIAKKHRVPLAPVKSAKIAGGPGLMQPDGIHPTGAGYRKLVEFLLPYVEKLLR